jgi:hypothetical protein
LASQSYEKVVFVKIVLLGLKRIVVPRSVARDRERQGAGQGIDHRDADAVQSARDLVRVVIELSARVQHGHDDLGRGAVLLPVNVGRNAAAVVRDGHRFVGMDRDDDAVAVAGEGFVDRVVDDLENHVVKASAVIGVADVHAGPLADGLETFQHLDFGGIVGVFRGGPGEVLHKPTILPEKVGFLLVFQLFAGLLQKLNPYAIAGPEKVSLTLSPAAPSRSISRCR